MRNGRKRASARCAVCGSAKSRFVAGGDIVSAINRSGKEFHLPGYNFCGPGTKLDRRLGPGDAPMTILKSECHQVRNWTFTKKTLSAFDDKRWYLCDGVNSYAHGHYREKKT